MSEPQRSLFEKYVCSVQTPFIHLVPKEFYANLDYREKARRMAASSRRMQQSLLTCCRRDVLYWANTFCYVFEPRSKRKLPSTTSDFQDELIREMVSAIENGYSLLVKKSRDMRVSWTLCIVFLWYWLFHRNSSFLMGSWKEEYVDDQDMKALMPKIDFVFRHLPPWMQPKRYNRVFKHFINHDNGAQISGEASSPKWGRGDRKTAMGMDEFAFWDDDYAALANTDDTTRCRIWVSTPNGPATAFFKQERNAAVRVLRLHWTKDPAKTIGQYSSENGRLVIHDRAYQFPAEYPFVLDGKIHSPWYDRMCIERNNDKVRIGQELDLDDYGSIQQFFDGMTLERYMAQHCEPPYHIGEIEYDADTLQPTGWSSLRGGRWKLWIHPDAAGRMPNDRRFVVACDVSAGTGTSNSTIAVGDCMTRRIVAMFVSPHISPEDLGRLAVITCRAFVGTDKDAGGARLDVEVNGPGEQTRKQVIDLIKYRHVMYRRSEDTITHKETDKPFWFSGPRTKGSLLGDLRRGMATDPPEIIIPDEEAVQEMREFVFGSEGNPEHARSQNAEDSSGAGDAHGDRVIPIALVKRMFNELPRSDAPGPAKIPVDCYAWRRDRYIKKKREASYW